MSSIPSLLSARVEAVTGIDPELRPATKPQFGHFQSNVALRLAKSEGTPPREVAAEIVARLEVADLCEPPEIAGPGLHQLPAANRRAGPGGHRPAGRSVRGMSHRPTQPQVVVIDYSAPERGQADARRAPAVDDHRRLPAPGHWPASATG